MDIPALPLRDGHRIPLLALGTGTAWFKKGGGKGLDQDLIKLIKSAIQKGFYHIDCAEMYGTEEEVGIAVKESAVPREKLFITSKVSKGIDDIPAALERSLEKVQTHYFDLYLIHSPFFAKSNADFHTAWKSMESLKKAGKVRSIGVSNFLRPHIEAILENATDPPTINQIEYHAYLQRGGDYVSWLRQKDIQVSSYKGLTPAFRAPDGPLKKPLARIAQAHATTEAVVLLAWIMQTNIVAITTTGKVERLDEYAQALKIKLTEQEHQEITEVGSTYHFRTSMVSRFEPDDRT